MTEAPVHKFASLKVDYDGPALPDDWKERAGFIQTTLGIRFARVNFMGSHSGGVHVLIQLADPLPAVVVVAVQALLGSDYRRETYNLVRVLALADTPAFWHPRWNVLYASKLGRTADMLNPDKFGRKPQLKADQIPADATVLTVQEAEEFEFEDYETHRKQPKLALHFAEFPEHEYWPNVTGIRNLCAKLGRDERLWVGKSVPLVRTKTQNPTTKAQVTVLWVATPAEWDSIVEEVTGAASKAPASKSAAKRAR